MCIYVYIYICIRIYKYPHVNWHSCICIHMYFTKINKNKEIHIYKFIFTMVRLFCRMVPLKHSVYNSMIWPYTQKTHYPNEEIVCIYSRKTCIYIYIYIYIYIDNITIYAENSLLECIYFYVCMWIYTYINENIYINIQHTHIYLACISSCCNF
jgi:hypothetical protein